jgi:hypothetical protein
MISPEYQKKLEQELANLIMKKNFSPKEFDVIKVVLNHLHNNQLGLEEFDVICKNAFIEVVKKEKRKTKRHLNYLSKTLDLLTADDHRIK